uniref:Uncharacterized protein n=1 Tax=Malus domestica TaxID=3750 RepID=E4Z8Q7_MALDO|nr:hypothetical protein [Malus domestica]
MGRARSGWEVKEWMRTERKTDSRGRFASRAVMARWVTVSRWFNRQRRRRRKLIFQTLRVCNSERVEAIDLIGRELKGVDEEVFESNGLVVSAIIEQLVE